MIAVADSPMVVVWPSSKACPVRVRLKILTIPPVWQKDDEPAPQAGDNRSSGTYQLVPTPEVQAMAGKQVRVGGFVAPLDGSDQTKDFLKPGVAELSWPAGRHS